MSKQVGLFKHRAGSTFASSGFLGVNAPALNYYSTLHAVTNLYLACNNIYYGFADGGNNSVAITVTGNPTTPSDVLTITSTGGTNSTNGYMKPWDSTTEWWGVSDLNTAKVTILPFLTAGTTYNGSGSGTVKLSAPCTWAAGTYYLTGAPSLNADGFPSESFCAYIFQTDGTDPYFVGTYSCGFKGQATITAINGSVSQTYNSTTNVTSFTVTMPSVGSTIWLYFANPSADFSDLQIVDRIDGDTYPIQNGKMFNNAFMQEMQRFAWIRFMDWTSTNFSTVTEWSQRAGKTNIASGRASYMQSWESVIAAANALNRDPWVCVPARASDSYIVQMANLFAATLNSNLKVYVQYSNETWNNSFSQRHDVLYAARVDVNMIGSAPDSYIDGVYFRTLDNAKIYGGGNMDAGTYGWLSASTTATTVAAATAAGAGLNLTFAITNHGLTTGTQVGWYRVLPGDPAGTTGTGPCTVIDANHYYVTITGTAALVTTLTPSQDSGVGCIYLNASAELLNGMTFSGIYDLALHFCVRRTNQINAAFVTAFGGQSRVKSLIMEQWPCNQISSDLSYANYKATLGGSALTTTSGHTWLQSSLNGWPTTGAPSSWIWSVGGAPYINLTDIYQAGNFINGLVYTIVYLGTTTNWTSCGWTTANSVTHVSTPAIGDSFTATGAGSGDGTARTAVETSTTQLLADIINSQNTIITQATETVILAAFWNLPGGVMCYESGIQWGDSLPGFYTMSGLNQQLANTVPGFQNIVQNYYSMIHSYGIKGTGVYTLNGNTHSNFSDNTPNAGTDPWSFLNGIWNRDTYPQYLDLKLTAKLPANQPLSPNVYNGTLQAQTAPLSINGVSYNLNNYLNAQLSTAYGLSSTVLNGTTYWISSGNSLTFLAYLQAGNAAVQCNMVIGNQSTSPLALTCLTHPNISNVSGNLQTIMQIGATNSGTVGGLPTNVVTFTVPTTGWYLLNLAQTSFTNGWWIYCSSITVNNITAVPVNTTTPSIVCNGNLPYSLGEQVYASNGAWTNLPTSFSYQWQRAGANIAGATSQFYNFVSADIGTAITCVVTAHNIVGVSATATTSSVTPGSVVTQVYTFEGDTLTSAPANMTVLAGTAGIVTNTGATGLSSKYLTGVNSGVSNVYRLDSFPAVANQTITLQYLPSNTASRFGILLRNQGGASAGASQLTGVPLGYLCAISNTQVVIWTVVAGATTYDAQIFQASGLFPAVFTWLRFSTIGNVISIKGSSDGINFTTMVSFTDTANTYPTANSNPLLISGLYNSDGTANFFDNITSN